MIVIDFDSLSGKPLACEAVKRMVMRSLAPRVTQSGEKILVPRQPIYWFTKLNMTIQDIGEAGFPAIGTLWGVKSVLEALKEMIKEIDMVAEASGIGATGVFRREVLVITDTDLKEIAALKATPLPVKLMEGQLGF